MSQASRAVVIEAEKFFSHRRVHDLLTAWGEQMRVWDESVPEAWGWPNHSVDPSQQYANGSTAGAMSLPEACVELLRQRGANIELIHKLVSALPLIPHLSLKYRYIYELDEPTIAVQLGTSERVVEQCLSSGRNAIRHALVKLKERVGLRRREKESI